MQPVRILLAEDDERYALRLRKNLEARQFDVHWASDGQQALERLGQESFDLVLADIKMPRKGGMELLRELKEDSIPGVDRDTAVVLLTSVDSVKIAVEAMQRGAADYLTKDAEWDEIVVHLEKVLENRKRERENQVLRQQVASQSPFGDVIAVSAEMNDVLKQVTDIAATQATVLITGETGVGKELIAREIHQRSPRSSAAFLDVNCAALPDDNMFQSEIFGHERGAFTGAYEQRKGRFELAAGGTLFLDEVGDLSIDSQAKLLRVLETRTFERLSGSRKITVDVRFILATNHHLQQDVEEGRFRRDLYYRINVFQIHIPPLRKRVEDIRPLALYYADYYQRQYGRPAVAFSDEALYLLESHSWPGNVRELRNVMERLLLLTRGDRVMPKDLQACGLGVSAGEPVQQDDLVGLPPQGVALAEVERAAIIQALERTDWVQKDAAELLQISVDRMNSRIRKFGITHPKWKTHRGSTNVGES